MITDEAIDDISKTVEPIVSSGPLGFVYWYVVTRSGADPIKVRREWTAVDLFEYFLQIRAKDILDSVY